MNGIQSTGPSLQPPRIPIALKRELTGYSLNRRLRDRTKVLEFSAQCFGILNASRQIEAKGDFVHDIMLLHRLARRAATGAIEAAKFAEIHDVILRVYGVSDLKTGAEYDRGSEMWVNLFAFMLSG
ncbi:hypothetical protein E8E13_001069 [Curvularia kusanoi]|uniref:Uncharacterized protein n=1 Tax=Curvularia kusanoi TaxID=90978 RepID=A0A9P4T3Q9_CURKU|nr:hypothetical protein E8E13_001069 [Curvularia kusanoi]